MRRNKKEDVLHALHVREKSIRHDILRLKILVARYRGSDYENRMRDDALEFMEIVTSECIM